MGKKSRTEYSVRNTTMAMISKIAAVLMGFVTRVVFTHTLSESYVGVNGLFSDLLNVLALSELGVGTAITYALYKPIAAGDIEKQKSLMKLYQFLYRIIAGIVFAAGLAVIPFMDLLIKNQPDIDCLVGIYLMYLANSVLSYLMIYKKTLIDAHQLSYLGEVYQMTAILVQDVLQIIILLTTHNFVLFLVIYMICTLGNNVAISKKADALFPYLKEKDVTPLPSEERKGIFKNIRAMLMHKIGDVVVNNTDNLLLSSIVGIISVGCYSNYYLIIGSVHQLMGQVFRGITASVGNLGATEESGRVKRIFECSFFVGQWIYGFAAICLYELLNPFVAISFGEQYVFPMGVVLILCMNFLITGMRQATLVFRDSLGLFWFDRYKSLANAFLNLVISVVLAYQYKTAGVFAGTLISTLLTSFWVEPWILYRHSLKTPVFSYFIRYGFYAAVIGTAWFVTHLACGFVGGTNWKILGVRIFICTIVPNFLFVVCYYRTGEFQFLLQKAGEIFAKKRGGAS